MPKTKIELCLLLGPTPALQGKGNPPRSPLDKTEMAGRAHTGKNVSEVLAFFYKMNESFARGLPAIQALTGSPVARGVTSDPHPADHPSPWTLAPGRGAGQKPRSAVGKGLRPHHTLMVIPGEYCGKTRGWRAGAGSVPA